MDNRLVWELVAIALLILANGFFSLAEFSIIASRKSKLRHKLDGKKKGAAKALKLREKPEAFLATIQIGITAVAVIVGVFSGATVVEKLAVVLERIPMAAVSEAATPLAMILVMIIITVASVLFGELVPKYLALSFPERYARRISGPISLFVAMTSIFSRILGGTAAGIVRLMGVTKDKSHESVSEEEINQMLLEGRELGVFDETEREFVSAVFDFADSTVRRAMTPRTDVIGLSLDEEPLAVLRIIKEHGYSRYPVYEKSIDQVVGVVYTKDILTQEIDPRGVIVKDLMRQPYFVPDSMPLPRLLREFQKGNSHLVIVLDEFGGTAGVISIEDVLEELVGEIQDEYDTEAAPLVKHTETVAYAVGSVWPGDVNEMLNTHLPEDNIDTLAGLLMDQVGRLPGKREVIRIADANLTVVASDRVRVLRVKIEKTKS